MLASLLCSLSYETLNSGVTFLRQFSHLLTPDGISVYVKFSNTVSLLLGDFLPSDYIKYLRALKYRLVLLIIAQASERKIVETYCCLIFFLKVSVIFLYPFLYISAFSPRWNETFTFIIQVPELALIRFVVESQGFITGNEFLGQYTVPLLCMNKGNVLKCKMILLSFICIAIKATL